MKTIDYIWYKLYIAERKSELRKPRGLLSASTLGVLLYVNIMTLCALLSKINLIPFVFHYFKDYIVYIQIFIILILYIKYRGKRALNIVKRYRVESNKKRIKGTCFVVSYCIITLVLAILVAFYKPGYIP